MSFVRRQRLLLSLLAVWFIWGSTYLAIRVALDSFPPLGMAGLRLTAAGLILLAIGRWNGEPWLLAREWGAAFVVGTLMFVLGNGSVMLAEETVSSGVVAVMVGAVPLYTVAIGRAFGARATARQWVSLVLGLCGIGLLNAGAELSGQLGIAALLTVGSVGWALGSVLSKKAGFVSTTMAAGAQMLAGGVVLGVAGLTTGEVLPTQPSVESVLAVLYLFAFGSIVAFTAYSYLLRHASLALATSYAYVNPVVAVLLGALLRGERLDAWGAAGLAVIVLAVVLLTLPERAVAVPAPA